MPVKIALFGQLTERFGREVELSSPLAGPPVADLRAALAAQLPDASGDLRSPRMRACVNDTVVGDDHIVAPGDTIALLPPVSGG